VVGGGWGVKATVALWCITLQSLHGGVGGGGCLFDLIVFCLFVCQSVCLFVCLLAPSALLLDVRLFLGVRVQVLQSLRLAVHDLVRRLHEPNRHKLK